MNTELTKDMLDTLFRELARQYRKLAGRNARAEIILAGGTSILLQYSFRNTASYSPKIIEHSLYYKIFSHVLEVRVISPTYLIAMKTRAAREYKK